MQDEHFFLYYYRHIEYYRQKEVIQLNKLFSALIDISELSESIVSDAGEVDHNMPYEQLYDRYQRYKLRYDKNRDRLEKVGVMF